MCRLLATVQRPNCLQIIHTVIFFSSHCYSKGMDDIGLGNHTRTSRAHHQGIPTRRDNMATGLNQESARIYQFPAGGRAALGGRHYGEAKPAEDTTLSNAAACSGSWYHAAAIEEAKPTPKPTWER
jgi:hypothetical protein